MQPRNRPRILRYCVSIAAVALALAIKFSLIGIVTQDCPFLVFFTAVMVAAWFGGLGAGLLATGLAAVLNLYFFMRPFERFSLSYPAQWAQLSLFIFECFCITLICTKWQAARQRAQEADMEARALERRILEISDAEQRRIGHDLHDGLGQHLTGIALMARRLEQRLAAETSPHSNDASKLCDLARTAVSWTHDLTRSLSPPALETRGLSEALRELVSKAENIFSVECDFEQDGEIAFDDVSAAVHLYRIAQEAISNAVKHGHAKHLRVRLDSKADNELQMQIIDDGSGIEPSNEPQDGMGLRIMRYRATMIGAQIEVQHRDRIGGEHPERTNGAKATGTIVTCRYRASNGFHTARLKT